MAMTNHDLARDVKYVKGILARRGWRLGDYDVDDIVQTAFCTALEKDIPLSGPQFNAVLWFTTRKYIQREWTRLNRTEDIVKDNRVDSTPSGLDRLIGEEEREAVMSLIDRLPEHKQDIMRLTMSGLDSGKVAEETGNSLTYVSVMKNRLTKMFSDILG